MEAIRARLNEQIGKKALASRFRSKDVNSSAMRHVALFPNIRVAYNRIKKNANTTTMAGLGDLDANTTPDGSPSKTRSLHITSAPLKEVRQLQNYSYLVVVRNPYTRVLSAFLDKFNKANYPKRFRPFDLTPAGFHEFIDWLRDGGLDRDKHWDLQHKIMLLPLEKFDAAIRFERYRDDMAKFLASRNFNATELLRTRAGTEASNRAEQFYTPEIAAKVYRLFESDFDPLSYPRELPGT